MFITFFVFQPLLKIIPIFAIQQKLIAMKNTLFALLMGVIMIGLASCGGGNKHSKGYEKSKKVLDEVMVNVEQAKDCEEIEIALAGIMYIYFVEDSITLQSEREDLSDMLVTVTEVANQKKVAMNCQEEEEFIDDVMPMEEPLEYEE